jgi:hypothetical protein
MAAASTSKRALMWLRRGFWRLGGPLAKKHSGYFFIWTRAAFAAVERLATRRPTRYGLDVVDLVAVRSRTVGASYRELESVADPVCAPPGCVSPQKLPASVALDLASKRGHGVLEIPRGVVSGKRGQIGLDSTELLLEASPRAPGDTPALLADSAAALAIGLEELDGVTMSLWAGQNNYAHCLLQSVPRLHLLQHGFGLEADRYLLRDKAPRPAVDALTILGIPVDRVQIVPFHDAPAYRCAMLRAATAPFVNEFGIPWVATFLNELFLPDPPPTHARRLYIRRGTANRAVLNEDDVLALLEPAGFEAVTMDGRSVTDQATMFASSEVVVASHGAALANLVFARPGTAVVELMGTNTASKLYALLAWRRALRYHLIMGTEPAPTERWWTWQFRADTIVDVRALRSQLERLDLL